MILRLFLGYTSQACFRLLHDDDDERRRRVAEQLRMDIYQTWSHIILLILILNSLIYEYSYEYTFKPISYNLSTNSTSTDEVAIDHDVCLRLL